MNTTSAPRDTTPTYPRNRVLAYARAYREEAMETARRRGLSRRWVNQQTRYAILCAWQEMAPAAQ